MKSYKCKISVGDKLYCYQTPLLGKFVTIGKTYLIYSINSIDNLGYVMNKNDVDNVSTRNCTLRIIDDKGLFFLLL